MTQTSSLEMAQAITTEYCKGCDPLGVQLALERVFIKHDAAVKEQKAAISGLRRTAAGLREALQALYDEQKGPPAKGAKKRWERAMQLAEAALNHGAE